VLLFNGKREGKTERKYFFLVHFFCKIEDAHVFMYCSTAGIFWLVILAALVLVLVLVMVMV
jgi:hypothetical protein